MTTDQPELLQKEWVLEGDDKIDKQDTHRGSLRSVCLRSLPGTVWGRVPRPPGTSRPDFCIIAHRLDRMSAGQTGHFHGTSGTCPRDGCGPEGSGSHRISLCLLVFLFPILGAENQGRPPGFEARK